MAVSPPGAKRVLTKERPRHPRARPRPRPPRHRRDPPRPGGAGGGGGLAGGGELTGHVDTLPRPPRQPSSVSRPLLPPSADNPPRRMIVRALDPERDLDGY